MDADYICGHLLKLSELLYGVKNKCYAKEKDGLFVFGSKTLKLKNVITKPIAIYLAVGDQKTKTNDNRKVVCNKRNTKTKKGKKESASRTADTAKVTRRRIINNA